MVAATVARLKRVPRRAAAAILTLALALAYREMDMRFWLEQAAAEMAGPH